MKLTKTKFVSHDGEPIFSIDIHPDGSRFATCGQGKVGVKIWNMLPVIDAASEADENIPKILCNIENHMACVNCVRWSKKGNYLASGGDDSTVIIYEFAGYGVSGGFGTTSVSKHGERWHCIHVLKRHTGDVLGLNWSPDDKLLASCSVDNNIVVWDAENFPIAIKILRGHNSLVKGVCWDPIGSYLASQSDDRTVKIWKTLDWKLEKTITSPFEKSNASTHVLRLDWSPEGSIITSAHAMNGEGPTAQIIERSEWTTELDFVGHRKAITCTRFNGNIFKTIQAENLSETKNTNQRPFTCVAIGSRDRSLSIWLTSLERPLCCIHDMFDDSIMDISWSHDGKNLLCCSWDGTVAYLGFEENELGYCFNSHEKQELIMKIYGKTGINKPLVIENPAMLTAQQTQLATKKFNKSFQKKFSANCNNFNKTQKESRTESGRRRIIPVFVESIESIGSTPKPFGSETKFSKDFRSNIKPSNEVDVEEATEDLLISKSSTKSIQKGMKKDHNLKISEEINVKKVFKEGLKNGSTKARCEKQRSTQVLKNTSGNLITEIIKENTCHQQKKISSPQQINQKQNENQSLVTAALTSTKNEHRTPIKDTIKKSVNITNMQSPRRGRPSKKRKLLQQINEGSKKVKKHHSHLHINGSSVQQRPTILSQQNTELDSVVRVRKTSSIKLKPIQARSLVQTTSLFEGKKCMITSLNNFLNLPQTSTKQLNNKIYKVTCSMENEITWTTAFSSPVVELKASSTIVGVALKNKQICALSLKSGRLLIPLLCKNHYISAMCVNENLLMIVDCIANVNVWNVKRQCAVLNDKAFNHILPSKLPSSIGGELVSPIKNIYITKQAAPIISFQNNTSYAFSNLLQAWTPIFQADDVIEKFSSESSFSDNLENFNSTDDTNIKDLLQLLTEKNKTEGSKTSESFGGNELEQNFSTVASMEQKLSSFKLLQSPKHYRAWLITYVRYMVVNEMEERLREICDDLIGPSFKCLTKSTNVTTWNTRVLGLSKRKLLKEDLLPIIATQLKFQRIYTDYRERLERTNES